MTSQRRGAAGPRGAVASPKERSWLRFLAESAGEPCQGTSLQSEPSSDGASSRRGVVSAERLAARIALLYASAALLWIVLSDRLVDWYAASAEAGSEVQTLKGGVFVLLTGVVLYVLVRRASRSLALGATYQQRLAGALSSLLRSMPVAAVVLDRGGKVAYWNPAAERTFGWSAREAIGNPYPLVTPAQAREFQEHLTRALQGENFTGLEIQRYHKDGSTRLVSVWTATVYGVDGESEGVAVIFADMADRRRAEEALQRYRLLAEHASEVVLFAAPDGRILDANLAAAATYGYPLPELCRLSVVDLHAPEQREEARQRLERARDTSIQFETVHCRRDGKTFPVEVELVGSDIGGNRILLNLIRDLTGRHERERRQELLSRLERLQTLGQMASGVAHDLGQSLAVVAGYGELMRQALDDRPPNVRAAREYASHVEQAAMDGGEAIRRLLSFGRARPEGPPELVELGVLLSDVAQLTAPRWRDAAQAEGRPIDLRAAAQPGLLVDGWPAPLREALTNMVFNAVDALPAGGTISLRAWHEEGGHVVAISDDGIGMTPDVRERIFDPFFTTKGEYGTGLGMPSVLDTVRAHGAEIDVDTAPGQGTTLRLRFPVARGARTAPGAAGAPMEPGTGVASAEPPGRDETARPRLPDGAAIPGARPLPAVGGESAALTASGPATNGPTRSRPLRILAVDDELTLVRMLAIMLGQLGHDVVSATSGEEAVERLREGPFDMVISDVGMGQGMNGWQLAEYVQGHYPATRFLLATGWAGEIEADEARRRGVDGVIAKPYRKSDLAAALTPARPAGEAHGEP